MPRQPTDLIGSSFSRSLMATDGRRIATPQKQVVNPVVRQHRVQEFLKRRDAALRRDLRTSGLEEKKATGRPSFLGQTSRLV